MVDKLRGRTDNFRIDFAERQRHFRVTEEGFHVEPDQRSFFFG